MVPEETLFPKLKMNIVTKFQVSIFKNDEVRGRILATPSNALSTYNASDYRTPEFGKYGVKTIP